MSINETVIDATPDEVFAVLSDADSYGYWVVGSSQIRDADAAFPAPGTRFHHTQGIGPVGIKDHTEVLEAHPPAHLVLRAKARPMGTARVELTLKPEDGGRTRVTIDERLVGTVGKLVPQFAVDPFLKLRNTESLRRLKRLSEKPGVTS